MGIRFEKLKKNFRPTDRPISVKQVQVRGNKNIFKVGLELFSVGLSIMYSYYLSAKTAHRDYVLSFSKHSDHSLVTLYNSYQCTVNSALENIVD